MIYLIFLLVWLLAGFYNFKCYYQNKSYKYLDVSDVLTTNELLIFSLVTGIFGLGWNVFSNIKTVSTDLYQSVKRGNSKNLSIKEISEIIGYIQFYLYEKEDLKVIDNCLKAVNKQTSAEMGITLVRSSFRFKNDLKNWTLAVNQIKQNAIKNKQDYKSILEGLI
jgi:hypothetical protein